MIKHNDIMVRRRNRANGDLEYQGIISIDKTIVVDSELWPVREPMTISLTDDGSSIAPRTYSARIAPDPSQYDGPLTANLQNQVFATLYGDLKPVVRELFDMAHGNPGLDRHRMHELATKLHDMEIL